MGCLAGCRSRGEGDRKIIFGDLCNQNQHGADWRCQIDGSSVWPKPTPLALQKRLQGNMKMKMKMKMKRRRGRAMTPLRLAASAPRRPA